MNVYIYLSIYRSIFTAWSIFTVASSSFEACSFHSKWTRTCHIYLYICIHMYTHVCKNVSIYLSCENVSIYRSPPPGPSALSPRGSAICISAYMRFYICMNVYIYLSVYLHYLVHLNGRLVVARSVQLPLKMDANVTTMYLYICI